MRVIGNGPIPARVMIVGEFPSEDDIRRTEPLSGASGEELNRMLQEAGIMRSDCYVTLASKERPPMGRLGEWITPTKSEATSAHIQIGDRYVLPRILESKQELLVEIDLIKPNVIIALGNLPLWMLTGNWDVLKWRGSQLKHGEYKLIPTVPPAQVFRQWDLRAAVLNDLRRVRRHMQYSGDYNNRPSWNFLVRPNFSQVTRILDALYAECEKGITWIDFDIETMLGHIDCIGLSWSRQDAMCIPFMTKRSREGYWSLPEEGAIVHSLYRVLTHENCRIRWQNGLYDAQYVYRHWHFIPRHGQDTMISQHSVFAAQPKGLGYLASMYADWYSYWKDEGKVASGASEEERWRYNLQDCVYTREVGEVLTETVATLKLESVEAAQQALFHPVLRAMLEGVRIDLEARAEMGMEIQEELSHRQAFLYKVLGHEINERSPKQMQALFYDDLKQPPILKRVVQNGRVTMRPTVDDEALSKIAAKEPLLRPITHALADIRTLNKFYSDFVMMPLDHDNRMRCSFNIAGDAAGKSAPYSYRLSSSKNAFNSGGNLQTIPSEKSKSSGKAAARGSMDFKLPNIRSMYVPDPGYTFFDMDLDRADLQVVVWEAEDEMLKAALRMGADIHLLNTYAIDGKEPPPLDELVESHPKYPDHRGPRKHKREFAKVFAHATNYLGKARTVAAHTGRTVHEIDRAQKQWFESHPGILRWHTRTIEQVRRYRFVENRFGYRWYIFDRVSEDLMPQAVAWVPQSTVGKIINTIWARFHEHVPKVKVLLQVHDSLAGQYPTHLESQIRPLMLEHSSVVVPYPDPLIIPAGIKTSIKSWGDCV